MRLAKHFIIIIFYLLVDSSNLFGFSKKYSSSITKEDLLKHLSILASDEFEGRETGTRGMDLSAEYISNHFKSIGLSKIISEDGIKTYYQPFSVKRRSGMINGKNVIGYIEGSKYKDEYLILTAHYDHVGISKNKEIYNGADDDASGTSAILEIAEAFSLALKEGKRPNRSVVFMLVAGEEKGLLGSKYYVDNPTFPLNKTITNLNIDMIGRVDSAHFNNKNYIYLIGSNILSDDLHKLSEKVNKKYSKINLDYRFNDPDFPVYEFGRFRPNRYYYRSDHYNFAEKNIPVIFYFNGTHIDYHQPTDTVEKIELDLITSRTKLIFHTAWKIVNRNKKVMLNNDID
mgnify:CR=1 FL=1